MTRMSAVPSASAPSQSASGAVAFGTVPGCRVDRQEMLRYLGYRGQELTPELQGRIDGVVERCERGLTPAGAFAVYPVGAVREAGVQGKPPRIELAGANVVLEGASIREHLDGAREVALMAVTLGAKSEQELRRLSATDPLSAVVYDAACSSLAEAAADAWEDRVVEEAVRRGLVTNWRFSPGYGDLPLSAQPAIVRALRADVRLGLTVLDSNLLLPSKSITAVVGLFEGEPPKKGEAVPCAACSLRATCEMRKKGLVCHGRTRN